MRPRLYRLPHFTNPSYIGPPHTVLFVSFSQTTDGLVWSGRRPVQFSAISADRGASLIVPIAVIIRALPFGRAHSWAREHSLPDSSREDSELFPCSALTVSVIRRPGSPSSFMWWTRKRNPRSPREPRLWRSTSHSLPQRSRRTSFRIQS